MRITRRRMLASLGGLGLAAASIDAAFIETRRHQVTRHRLDRATGAATAASLRIVQLSDLHLRGVARHEEAVAESVAELEPDLLLFTGDTVDRPAGIADLRDFLGLLDTRAAMYAILGNWEHWAGVDLGTLRATFATAGCDLLINRSVVLDHEGAELLITGLDDLVGGRPDAAGALEGTPHLPNHLLLAHCPEQRDRLDLTGVEPDRRPPDYVLSGHTHGGQVAVFGWAPFLPRGCGPYLAGWYGDAAPRLYVSRGLGTSGLPVRFGSVPEVAVFDWQLAQGGVAMEVGR